MGVVTAIYTNLTNKSKENLRYSAATRIATQIVENIQSKCYDELIHRCSGAGTNGNLSEVEFSKDGPHRTVNGGKIFDVKVPVGYSAKVELSNAKDLDIVRNVTVTVKYKILGFERNVTLYTVKQKELLEQTNKPDLTMIKDYATNGSKYYSIKKVDANYIVTTTSDPDWYNYDSAKIPALVVKSETAKNIGDVFAQSDLTSLPVYVWVPRYARKNTSELTFLYGTSSYEIQFGTMSNGKLIGYYISGSGTNTGFNMPVAASYYGNTFTETDGKTGVWYCLNQTGLNDGTTTTIYNQLKTSWGNVVNNIPF